MKVCAGFTDSKVNMKINIRSRQSRVNSSRSILPPQAARKLGKIYEMLENCERRNKWGDCFLRGGAFWTGAEGGGPKRQQQAHGGKGRGGVGDY